MPLNPTLYTLLCNRFRPVIVASEGETMSCDYYSSWRDDRIHLAIHAWGESYRIDCPFCMDGRQRLYISHRYGVYDEVTESDNLQLFTCFNERCQEESDNRSQLADKVFGFVNRAQRKSMSRYVAKPSVLSPATLFPTVEWPGECVSVSQLGEAHPAWQYLVSRGFDVDELTRTWNVRFCVQATSQYWQVQERIIIPFTKDGHLIGWQGREIPGLCQSTDPGSRYFTKPGLPKAQLLYNQDLAMRQSCIVVCEGVTDVWRVGPRGVALLGKTMSLSQLRLLNKHWAQKPLIVLLDGDAKQDADKLCGTLRSLGTKPLVQVTLPLGKDPAEYDRADLWSIIEQQASSQRVLLPPPPLAA